MATRSKRRRLMQSYILPRTDLPAIFESLNDDTLTTTLQFVGKKSYRSFGGINKHCKEVYLNTPGMTKETFLYGYAPLSVIRERLERSEFFGQYEVVEGVLRYNRRDVLKWALERNDMDLLEDICYTAAEEGRIDLLIEVWNDMNDDKKAEIFQYVGSIAAESGKLNVLKWLEEKGLSINIINCAQAAACGGHLHILKWLQEEKGLELYGYLYYDAIRGGHLHLMKWLREQEVPWHCSGGHLRRAAEEGNLDILQWLHDEGCPWPEYIRGSRKNLVREIGLKREVLDWLRMNGYSDRIKRYFLQLD